MTAPQNFDTEAFKQRAIADISVNTPEGNRCLADMYAFTILDTKLTVKDASGKEVFVNPVSLETARNYTFLAKEGQNRDAILPHVINRMNALFGMIGPAVAVLATLWKSDDRGVEAAYRLFELDFKTNSPSIVYLRRFYLFASLRHILPATNIRATKQIRDAADRAKLVESVGKAWTYYIAQQGGPAFPGADNVAAYMEQLKLQLQSRQNLQILLQPYSQALLFFFTDQDLLQIAGANAPTSWFGRVGPANMGASGPVSSLIGGVISRLTNTPLQ